MMDNNTLTEQEKYAIVWCFNRAMDKFDDDGRDVIVNGVNINETIKNLIGRLFI